MVKQIQIKEWKTDGIDNRNRISWSVREKWKKISKNIQNIKKYFWLSFIHKDLSFNSNSNKNNDSLSSTELPCI